MTIGLSVMLQKGRVNFKFWEKDGKLRIATGSLHPSLLPQQVTPPKKPRKLPWPRDFIVFYDLGEGGWRTFKPSLLIEVMDNTEVL